LSHSDNPKTGSPAQPQREAHLDAALGSVLTQTFVLISQFLPWVE
jgi:hypothetical protein